MSGYKNTESTKHLLQEYKYFRPLNGVEGLRNLSDEDLERFLEVTDGIKERLSKNKGNLDHGFTQAIPFESAERT